MAAITARPDIRDKTAKHRILIWKSQAVSTGDTMVLPGTKLVFAVLLSNTLAWSFTAATNTLTFTTVGGSPLTGPIVIICR